MEITRIEIARRWSGADEPFYAKVYCRNQMNAAVEVQLDEQRTLALIHLIDDLIVEAVSDELTALAETAQAAIDERNALLLETTATEEQPL